MPAVSPPFHIQLYCVSEQQKLSELGPLVEYNGFPLQRCDQPNELSFFGASFEQLLESLQKFQGVYAEWDGSWSWTASDRNEHNHPLWRIEGMIYDRDSKVFYVDMQGECTIEAWKIILDGLAVPPERRLAICIAQLGWWVTQSSFEQWFQAVNQTT